MDIKNRKKVVRAFLNVRAALMTREYKRKAGIVASAHVLSLDSYRNADTVFCFVATEKEPDTRAILVDAIVEGKRLCVPYCADGETMRAVEIRNPWKDLRKGRYGIMEPVPGLPEVDPAEIDLSIVPCVGCDRKGARIGHGRGYYDRFLPQAGGEKVILCFAEMMQEEGNIPTDAYDILIPAVITEK